jgi:hypothetical protein
MSELEAFSLTYQKSWESRATVRNSQRFRPTSDDAESVLLPDQWLLLARDPAVAASGEAGRRYLAAQGCYRMMEEIALLETDMVTDCCHHVANGSHGVPLPDAARQAALTIGIDEVYHAYVAREFIERMAALNGIRPDGLPRQSSAERALAVVLERLPEELRGDFKLIALSLTENVITDEVMGLTKGTEPDNPFHHICREHLVDEARHQAYFRQLLKYIWPRFDPEARGRMIEAVPVFVEEFLVGGFRLGPENQKTDLRRLGLQEAEIEAAFDRLRRAWGDFDKSELPMWINMRRAMQLSGLLEDAQLCEALDAAGWSAAAGPTVDDKPG